MYSVERVCSARSIIVACVSMLLFSCASSPTVLKYDSVPSGGRVAVIPFRDCTIPGQDDCGGSGNIAGGIYARVLASHPGIQVQPVSRPVGAGEALTDDAAVKFAATKGFDYVVNGEMNDFYRVAPMTFRNERVGISIRVLRVSDGKVVSFQNEAAQAGNLTTPERMLERLAAKLSEKL
jgi:hypothetical protein